MELSQQFCPGLWLQFKVPSILRNLDLQITIWENLTSRKKTLTSKLGPAWENIAGNHCGKKKIAFSVSDTGGTLENKLNNLKPLFDLFSHKKCFTFWKWSKKMLLHIRRQILPTRVNNNHRKLIWLSWPLSMKQTLDWHMSIFLTSWANQVLHSLASRGFQNPGVCLQAFPSFPRSRSFIFWLLFHMRAAKPKIPFLKSNGSACHSGYSGTDTKTPRCWLKSEVKRNCLRPTLRCLGTCHFRNEKETAQSSLLQRLL